MRHETVETKVGPNSMIGDVRASARPVLKNNARSDYALIAQVAKAMKEATGLLRRPQRILPLINKIAADSVRAAFEPRNLYCYTRTRRASSEALKFSVRWILDAQRADGGIAAYYSLLTGYSESYPEVTGYIVPTLYDFANVDDDKNVLAAAERATQWLLSLQMPTGAFCGGLHGRRAQPSIFNTGQILQGLIRAHRETNRPKILRAAIAAGDWLVEVQQVNGSWSGPAAYQETAHTYYSMVAWALAELFAHTRDHRYAHAAERNLDWILPHFRRNGWIDGINLRGHPVYLHFIAYVLQGVLECALLLRRSDAIEAVTRAAWGLLRKFETSKFLAGAYEENFKSAQTFTCVTGNAQMSCVWLRLFEVSGDLRYLNAGLKMNEMIKGLVPQRGPRGIAGGVSGSYPIWGRYQPLRYISWGCKFFVDALLQEQRLTQSFKALPLEIFSCAS